MKVFFLQMKKWWFRRRIKIMKQSIVYLPMKGSRRPSSILPYFLNSLSLSLSFSITLLYQANYLILSFLSHSTLKPQHAWWKSKCHPCLGWGIACRAPNPNSFIQSVERVIVNDPPHQVSVIYLHWLSLTESHFSSSQTRFLFSLSFLSFSLLLFPLLPIFDVNWSSSGYIWCDCIQSHLKLQQRNERGKKEIWCGVTYPLHSWSLVSWPRIKFLREREKELRWDVILVHH